MTPISTEQSKSLDYQERQLITYKEQLIDNIDEIGKNYDGDLSSGNPETIKQISLDIVEYLDGTENGSSNGNSMPVRVIQAIGGGKGTLYGLGFGIEISAKEAKEQPSLRFDLLSRFSKKLESLEHGNYSTSTPTLYHYRENGSYSRESVICTAQVLTSDLFRNMNISDDIKTDIIGGVLREVSEREDE